MVVRLTFFWWDSQTSTGFTPTNLSVGNYTFFVSDSKGRQATLNITIETFDSISTSIKTIPKDFFSSISPNPTITREVQLYINTSQKQEIEVIITSITGAIYSKRKITTFPKPSNYNLKIPDEKGIYFIQLRTSDKLLNIHKIIAL